MPRRPSIAQIALTMLIALAVSAVAVMLGFWQFHRHEAKSAARAAYEAAQEQPAAGLDDVIPVGSADLPDDAEWRTVTVTGTFEADTATYLRGRPIDSSAAWQFLAWLDTDDGRSILVSTGWIEQPGPNDDPAVPEYPDHEVTVTGVVRAWEEDDGKTPSHSVTRIAPEQLAAPAGDAVPGYLMIREYCDGADCSPTVVGDQVPLPDVSLGPHLSYAVQWWLFALMAPVGGVLLLRRDAREAALGQETTDADPSALPGPRPPAVTASASATRVRRKPRALSDEEIEDALSPPPP